MANYCYIYCKNIKDFWLRPGLQIRIIVIRCYSHMTKKGHKINSAFDCDSSHVVRMCWQ